MAMPKARKEGILLSLGDSKRGIMVIANQVADNLARIDLPPKAGRFLTKLYRMTFNNKGFHAQEGREDPGLWCVFDLRAWLGFLDIPEQNKSQLIHLRNKLVEEGFIWYEPEYPGSPRGRIGWNLHYDEWKRLDPDAPKWGGERMGAGRPKGQNKNQVINGSLNARDIQVINEDIQVINEDIQVINARKDENYSSYQRYACLNDFKLSTLARYDAKREQRWCDPLRKDHERRDHDPNAIALGAADADVPPALPAKSKRSSTPKVQTQKPAKPKHTEKESTRKIADLTEVEYRQLAEYRKALFALLTEDYPRMPASERAREAKTMTDLWFDGVSVEDVRRCWKVLVRNAFLLRTGQVLHLSKVKESLAAFMNDPEGVANAIEEERKIYEQRRNGGRSTQSSRANRTPVTEHSPSTRDGVFPEAERYR